MKQKSLKKIKSSNNINKNLNNFNKIINFNNLIINKFFFKFKFTFLHKIYQYNWDVKMKQIFIKI